MTAAPPRDLREGQKLAGCYILQRRIGGAYSAAVWVARDEVLDKDVSLHFLPAAVLGDKAAMAALRLEVKRARPLIHPNILRIYDLIEEADWAAIAMDVFEARSLAAVVQERGALEPADIEPWLGLLGETLEEAHRNGFTHRDLAPENVFVAGSRGVFIAGFGISRVIQDSLQRAGESSRSSNLSPPRRDDDIYGLGALLFHALTGEPVCREGELARPMRVSEVWRRQGKATVLSSGWDETIAACLSEAPESRPSSPVQLLAKLAGTESTLATALPAENESSEPPEGGGPKRKASEILAERAAQFRAEGGRPSLPTGPKLGNQSEDQRANAKIEDARNSAASRGSSLFIPPRPARRPIGAMLAFAVVTIVGVGAFGYHRLTQKRAASQQHLAVSEREGERSASSPDASPSATAEGPELSIQEITAPPQVAAGGGEKPPREPEVEGVLEAPKTDTEGSSTKLAENLGGEEAELMLAGSTAFLPLPLNLSDATQGGAKPMAETEALVPPEAAAIAEGTDAPAKTATATVVFENSLGLKFVTVGQVDFCVWPTRVQDFEVYAKAVNLRSRAWKTPNFRQAPDHPVVNVSWNEAVAFCQWLTKKERKEGQLSSRQLYRLPTDLEWSAAVGLGNEAGPTPEARNMSMPEVYPWGSTWPPPESAGNYPGTETGLPEAIKGFQDNFPWTATVGSFPPNQLGLYDVGGNVWQWCVDSWNDAAKSKVLRGGSWFDSAVQSMLLSSARREAAPDRRTDHFGFRIVRAMAD